MKKTIIFILIILALTLTSCSKKEETDNNVKTTSSGETTATTSKATFNIIYELGNIADHFTITPAEAKSGDTVELKTEILIDADIHVYVDEKEIDKSHYDSDYWGYSFIMPDKDVKVTARFYTKDEILGTMPDELAVLEENFPDYFGIDASEGLDVIVWQMAGNSYSFGLLKHSGTERNWVSEELLNLKSAKAEQMKKIISSYGVDSKDVYIIPWQNPVSSYISGFWTHFEGEEQGAWEKRR
ncbi:MAG: hypothetical protein IJS94_07790, partial [Clostridia bacterium]|nr:hypothetical protein [Clostridia bacterium]